LREKYGPLFNGRRRFIEHVARMHIDSVEALIYAIDVPSLLSICNDEAERIK